MKPLSKPSILIVDDEPELINSLSLLLEDGFDILTASNGREALRIIKDVPLSLLLLDLRMPELGGLELLDCLKKINRKVPIIILSGNFECAATLQEPDLFVCAICKPVVFDLLIDKIKEILGNGKTA